MSMWMLSAALRALYAFACPLPDLLMTNRCSQQLQPTIFNMHAITGSQLTSVW